MQPNSTPTCENGHASFPEGLSLEGGLDFSPVASDCGRFRETETGSGRWKKNLPALLLVLGSVEKLTVSQGQSTPKGEFAQKPDDPKWGQMRKQCLDQITGKLDDVCISEHVRRLALSTHDPLNYESAGLCMCTCEGMSLPW